MDFEIPVDVPKADNDCARAVTDVAAERRA
jgi:hypothetical protein